MKTAALFQEVSKISKRTYKDPETNQESYIYVFRGRQPLSPAAFEDWLKPLNPQAEIACGVKRDRQIWTIQVHSELALDHVINSYNMN